jgi:hypothetical protein
MNGGRSVAYERFIMKLKLVCFFLLHLLLWVELLYPVQKLSAGDNVVPIIDGGQLQSDSISRAMSYVVDHFIQVQIKDICVCAAPDHKFYSCTRQDWVSASELQVSEQLLCGNGNVVTVDAIQTIHKHETIYSYPVEIKHVLCVMPPGAENDYSYFTSTTDTDENGYYKDGLDDDAEDLLKKIHEKVAEERRNYKGPYCCLTMDVHLSKEGTIVHYDSQYREYTIGFPNGGVIIAHCMFCGKAFPGSVRDEWFEILEKEYELESPNEEDEKKVPQEFWTDEWWKKRGL